MRADIGTSFLEEYNYISKTETTHFYAVVSKPIRYGVCVNVKDIDKIDTIINDFKKSEKFRIEAWRKDLLQQKYINIITSNNIIKQNKYLELLINGGDKTKWIKENLQAK